MASRKKRPGRDEQRFIPAQTDPAGPRRQRRAKSRLTTLDDVPLSRHTQRSRSKRINGTKWRGNRAWRRI